MNVTATKAFLRGALDDPTTNDEQIQEIIEFLRRRMELLKLEQELIDVFRDAMRDGLEVPSKDDLFRIVIYSELDQSFIGNYGKPIWNTVHWDKIFREIHRVNAHD